MLAEEPTTYSESPRHEDLKNDFDFTLASSDLKNFTLQNVISFYILQQRTLLPDLFLMPPKLIC